MTSNGKSRFLFAGAILLTISTAGRAAWSDQAAGATSVRSGSHRDFGRVVIDTNGRDGYEITREGDQFVVHLNGDLKLGQPPAPPRNIVAIKTDGARLELTLRRGARFHPMRIDGRVVLDALDDPAGNTPTPSAPASTLSMAASPELGGRSLPRAPSPMEPPPMRAEPPPLLASAPAPTPPSPPAVEATQPTAPGRDVMPEIEGPIGLRARRVKLPKDMDGAAFLVPFESTTGAAAFRSGNSTIVVFDERRAVDMAALKDDPVFGAATISLLAKGTLLSLPHPISLALALTQVPQGWRIAALKNAPKRQPIAVANVDGRLNLSADKPADVIVLADPGTGATLLVGTQQRPGQGVGSRRRSAEFILHPTIQGVVVEPLSDQIDLRQTPTGFSLTGGRDGLAISPPAHTTDVLLAAANLTRRLNFSQMPQDALLRLAIQQLGDAAFTPPIARGSKHRGAAESFLALGLAAEAQSLLRMAREQDPKQAASATTGALAAIAAILAGRPAESVGLLDPRLDGTDEIALWRGIRQAMLDEGSPSAAAVFATNAPLVFQYPTPIREHLLPLIVETMIQGGEIAPAARLLSQRQTDPRLAYAQALLLQAEGDTAQALAKFDALANGHDQFDRARAAIRAVELRLATRVLDKAGAADALDKLLYAWRGDARELALRQRVAELRGQNGSWRQALTILRQAEADFPERAAPIHQRLKELFADAMRDKGSRAMPPIEFVAMVGENTDLLPESGDDEMAEETLADRLLALDLPTRAKPVLEKLLRATKSQTARARFGAGLATLAAREGDDAGVETALDASTANDLPFDLVEERVILRAEAMARRGDPTTAAAMLTTTRTAKSTEARARILENAGDWSNAATAWADSAALTLPDSGMLTEIHTRTILRLATATARAGNEPALAELRLKFDGRIAPGALGDMFRLLTAEPVRATSDIGRAQKEVNLAASMPANLKAVRAETVPR